MILTPRHCSQLTQCFGMTLGNLCAVIENSAIPVRCFYWFDTQNLPTHQRQVVSKSWRSRFFSPYPADVHGFSMLGHKLKRPLVRTDRLGGGMEGPRGVAPSTCRGR